MNFRNVFTYKSSLRNSIFMKFDIFTKWTSKTKKRMFFVQHDHYKHGLPGLIKLFFIPFCFFMFMCEKYIGNDINILSSWNLKFKSQKFEFWGNIQVRKTVQYIYIIKLFAHTYIYMFPALCNLQYVDCWWGGSSDPLLSYLILSMC